MASFLDELIERTPSKGDQARLSLMEAAIDVFGERQFEAATTREIASKAGQNVAAISYYFGGKEKLYHSLIELLGEFVGERIDPPIQAAKEWLKADEPEKEPARQHILDILDALAKAMLCEDEAVGMCRILMREQMAPTAGFELFYRRVIEPIHQVLCCLIGHLLNLPEDEPQVLIHAQAFIGEIHIFRSGREVFLRRSGLERLAPQSEAIRTVLQGRFHSLLNNLHLASLTHT